MSPLRTHVLTLLAALLALAVGVALGSGPLRTGAATGATTAPEVAEPGSDRAGATGGTGAPQPDAGGELDALGDGTTYADDFALSVSGRLVGGALDGRAVTLLALPGAAPDTVAGIADMVTRAGGRVVAEVRVERPLVDVADRQLVGELGRQMVESAGEAVRVPPGAGDYERLGRLLARATLTPEPEGAPVDVVGRGVLAGLETAGLVTTTDDVGTRGSLLVAVAGTPYGDEDERDGAGTIVASLLLEATRTARAVVLAGPVGSGAPDGLVGRVRTDRPVRAAVSTVDAADRVAGRIATVLALAVDVAGRSGHYGTAEAPDGPRPAPR